jgi:hypothetical protein
MDYWDVTSWWGSPKLRKVWCLRIGGDLCCALLGSGGLQELSSVKSEIAGSSEMYKYQSIRRHVPVSM